MCPLSQCTLDVLNETCWIWRRWCARVDLMTNAAENDMMNDQSQQPITSEPAISHQSTYLDEKSRVDVDLQQLRSSVLYSVIYRLVHTADKTRQSCLVGSVNRIIVDCSRLSCRQFCKRTSRLDKTVSKFNHGKYRNCFVESRILFAPPTRQDKTVIVIFFS